MSTTRAQTPRWILPLIKLGLQPWDLAALFICLVAFWHGWRATRDLAWPPDFDLYRDASIAQTMLDGGGLSDPAYPGERLWYNPLVPALVAGLSRMTGQPVPAVYARAGAYLNLLAPLCFYLVIALLFKDRLIALASTLAFLFVTCQHPPSRACATYSPWLFTANFTQAGFYLTLALYERALRRSRRRDFLPVGLALGLTFLGHTAPALILGSIILLHTAWTALHSLDRTLSSPQLHESIVRLGIITGAALAVGAPYLRIILCHYRIDVLNPAPSSWIFSELEMENFLTFARANLSLPNLVALVGGIVLLARPRDRADRAAHLLALWLIVCVGFIGLSYVSQLAERLDLPALYIVPPIHFLFYLKALVSALFGYGVLVLIRFVLQFVKYLLPWLQRRLPGLFQTRVEKISLILLAFAAAMCSYGPFARQPALNAIRERAQTVIPTGWRNAYTWIRKHTSPSDVFLAPPYLGLHIVTPAGRKVVALKPVFSNPFINAASRLEHNSAMYDYLQAGDSERFAILASAYEVRYVATIDNAQFAAHHLPLEPVFKDTGVTAYAVSLPPATHVNLGGKVEFLGHVMSRTPDGQTQVELTLRCVERMKDNYTLWFHADAQGKTTTFDHALSTSEWRVGQIVQDTFLLDLPPDRYDLSFGLWMPTADGRSQGSRRLWRPDNGEPGIHLGQVEIR
jgi:hypothetical protein